MSATEIPFKTVSSRALGGEASSFVSPNGIGFGLMGFTWARGDTNTSDEIAFECMREAIRQGSLIWSSASFYGRGEDYLDNIKLVRRFFEAHPQYKDKVFLSVKGGFKPVNALHHPDSSEEALREELAILHEHLPPHVKKIDAYGPARVDTSRPIEETMKNLVKLQSEGLFSYIFLSEAGAETLQRACSAFPGKVIANEVEYNPFSLDIEELGVLDVAKKNDVAIWGYSPFSTGILTGQLRSIDQLEKNDFRRMLDRYSPENFHKNVELADNIGALAQKSSKKILPTQLTLAWALAQYEKMIPLTGSTNPKRNRENLEAGDVQVEPELIKEYRAKVDEVAKQVHGIRYNKQMQGSLLR